MSRRDPPLPPRKPVTLAVAGALADLSPFPRLGGMALAPLPQGGVISFRIELSRLSGAVLDLQCGAYMPADQLADMLRRTADRIEAICHDYATKHPEPTPDDSRYLVAPAELTGAELRATSPDQPAGPLAIGSIAHLEAASPAPPTPNPHLTSSDPTNPPP